MTTEQPAPATSDLYAVFGNPVEHSKSPQIHAMFAQQCCQHMRYEKRLAELDRFSDAMADFIADGGKGANITVPFKIEAYELCDRLSERARSAGAVNTFHFVDGEIFGDNTDGIGLVTDIMRNAGQALQGQRVLLLGAGGASRGVLLPLLQERPAKLCIANRGAANAHALHAAFMPFAGDTEFCASGLDEIKGEYDVIINATSASLGSQRPDISSQVIAADAFVYDMVYGKTLSPFLEWAQAHEARVRDGLGMLVEQAAHAFLLWRQVMPETAQVHIRLRSEL